MAQLSLVMCFRGKLSQWFGHLQNVIVIADDIMVVGKEPNHKDHDLALATLLNTAGKCNVCLKFEKLQYKQKEVEFFRETFTLDGQKPARTRSMPYKRCCLHNVRSKYSHLLA